MLYTILVVIQVLTSLALVGLILIQHGKGADAGAAFGSGASGTVFGSQGSANFLSRLTAALATVFFVVSLSLAYLVSGGATQDASVTERVEVPAQELFSEDEAQEEEPSAPAAPSTDQVPE